VNRKLIRPTLAEIKGKGRETSNKEQTSNGDTTAIARSSGQNQLQQRNAAQAKDTVVSNAATSRKRIPPVETFAEIFYYKKQMDAHTPMIIVLQDGEEIEGTIEWYDREALKINRRSAPNILLLKHNIKYMFKAEDREEEET
jgi:sRNA-binding regulator protein Hfq